MKDTRCIVQTASGGRCRNPARWREVVGKRGFCGVHRNLYARQHGWEFKPWAPSRFAQRMALAAGAQRTSRC